MLNILNILLYCLETMGYLEWAPWSVCSKSCDVGFRQRFRSCIMDEEECDRTIHTQDCNIFQCPGIQQCNITVTEYLLTFQICGLPCLIYLNITVFVDNFIF